MVIDMAIAPKEEKLRRTLSGIIVSTLDEGPTIDIDIEDGPLAGVITLRFVSKLPFHALAALLEAGPTVGLPLYISRCIKEESREEWDKIQEIITFDGLNDLVAALTEMYSGNSPTPPASV